MRDWAFEFGTTIRAAFKLYLFGEFQNKTRNFSINCSLGRDGLCFCASGNKNVGNAQQNARRERLFIRKSAFSAIFCCGFGDGKYYHRCRKSCLCPFCQKIFFAER